MPLPSQASLSTSSTFRVRLARRGDGEQLGLLLAELGHAGAGDTATVTCRFVVQFADEHGLKKPTETNTRLSLRKKGPSWIIEEMRQSTAP